MTPYTAIASNKRRSALLIACVLTLVIGVGWVWDTLEGGGTAILPLAVLVSIGSALTGYAAGDRIALAANGAIPVQKSDVPELYRLVENLSITAGLPMPRLYLLPSPAMNAFATGRDPQHASIAVTRGALELLTPTELEGVLAHELSHIQNYDIRLMTIVAVFVGTVALLGDWFLRSRLWGGHRRDREGSSLSPILGVIGLVFLLLAPLVAYLIQLAVSRRREFFADASGVLLTRYPEGLASALEKIRKLNRPVAHANRATAHLYFSNPLSGNRMSTLFSTHPPLEERIHALTDMGSLTPPERS